MTANDVIAGINIALGLLVFVLNVRILFSRLSHRWIYAVGAIGGLLTAAAFTLTLFRYTDGTDQVPFWIGRPAFTFCLLGLGLISLVVSRSIGGGRNEH
jgi:hypothetical protein